MKYKELLEDKEFDSPEEVCKWMNNASTAITDLLSRAEAAEARAEKAEGERDSAIHWIREFTESIHNPCVSCKHDLGDYVDINVCGKCSEENSKWEWNGGKKEE